MKRSFLILAILTTVRGLAQVDTINQRIFLVGDAGEMSGSTHPVIAWLKKNADWNDDKNTVIYLGDNVYPLGLPFEGEADYSHSKQILDDQINLVRGKKARAFFVPGNHDWRDGKLGGWQQVMNQVDYINSLDQKNIQAWPLNGCPGPIPIELSDKIVLALIDSQWFLYLHDKPGPGSSCPAKTIDEFEIELREIANTHPNQLLIVAMHHPINSYGIHGGDYTWKEHIFPFTAISPNLYIPLPVIGSLYPLTRGVFGSIQDIPHPLYKTMANTIEDAIKQHPNTVIAAGHDHGLQLNMRKDSIPNIISGSGSLLSRIRPGRFSLFSDVEYGFAMIEVWKSGKVDVKFYNLNSTDLNNPTYTNQFKTIRPPAPTASVDTTRPIFDSVVIAAANSKLEAKGLKAVLFGKNYRKEWTEPLHVRVLDMGTEHGGLKPIRQTGGKQTKALRVEDTSGKQWSLRSVNKDPVGAIPPDLRQTAIKDIVQDGISASYPYGTLSMGVLSQAAGVPYLRNKLVYLPDDPRLDRFRSTFKNTMALMEERVPPGAEKTDNTDELLLKLAKNNNNRVDQLALLRARLLDNFVMDFDRAESQWLWATRDTTKGKVYYPIPEDRDQVFFVNEGLVPRFARKPSLVPELQGFRPRAKNIKTFNRAVRNFDRTFLTELNKKQWNDQIDSFLKSMTDSVIETALHQQPVEIQQYNAQKIINTLKERRKYFKSDMIRYYDFISRTVSIVGSNEKEQFTITKNTDGTVHVVVNKIAKDGSLSTKMYDRLFDPKITKEIRLFGLNDDDRFIVGGGNSPIRIRIVGGSGNDEFINNGNGGKVWIYDVTFEKNKVSGNPGFHKRISPDPQANQYNRLNYKYNLFDVALALDYNVDDGLFIGPRFQYISQGFRKEPYGSRQSLLIERALKTASYHIAYNADYIKAIGNTDISVRSDFKAPDNVTNFFGIGNNTIKDNNKPNAFHYYRSKYDIINASAYFRRQLQSWMRVYLGPSYQHFRVDSIENLGRFVNEPDNGLNHSTLDRPRSYLGGDLRVEINSRNNDMLPTRGIQLDAGIRPLFGINGASHNVTMVNLDMRIFMSLATQKRLVLATRFGWGKNYGDYLFPQAQYLSGTDNLRGYRKQRFAGRAMLYNNTELRIKISDFNTYLFPGSIGLQVFNDIGRVFADGEKSNMWHDGYGLGIWVAPINRIVITASLAHSEEEKALPRVTFGFEF